VRCRSRSRTAGIRTCSVRFRGTLMTTVAPGGL
jgi:hypothetical protein